MIKAREETNDNRFYQSFAFIHTVADILCHCQGSSRNIAGEINYETVRSRNEYQFVSGWTNLSA